MPAGTAKRRKVKCQTVAIDNGLDVAKLFAEYFKQRRLQYVTGCKKVTLHV